VSARELPLAGRHALVTGAASGIGRATARRLAAAGAAVVVDHLRDAEAAGVLVAEIERDGARAVTDEAQVDAMFARQRRRPAVTLLPRPADNGPSAGGKPRLSSPGGHHRKHYVRRVGSWLTRPKCLRHRC